MQDPSYQFKDIKQLMMGMLETYNYEEVQYICMCVCVYINLYANISYIYMYYVLQTLLKTTNHILVHDVRGSLSHLCDLVQQGVSPYSRQCVVCSRPADCLADGSKDDVIVFRYACTICTCIYNIDL